MSLFFDNMHVLGGVMKDLMKALLASNSRNSTTLMQYEHDVNGRFANGKPPTILSKDDIDLRICGSCGYGLIFMCIRKRDMRPVYF